MRKDEQVKLILEALKTEVGMEYDYDHFEEEKAQQLPYAIYRRTASRNFGADGKVYYRGRNVELEIYAANPDEMADIMEKVEKLLDENELFYGLAADTVYLEKEKIYGTLYDI